MHILWLWFYSLGTNPAVYPTHVNFVYRCLTQASSFVKMKYVIVIAVRLVCRARLRLPRLRHGSVFIIIYYLWLKGAGDI